MPATRAVWNGDGADEGLSRANPRPGVEGPIIAASPDPMMSFESLRSTTRSAMRRLMFDCISGVTTPEGRWVASTRLTPSERPTRAIRTSPSMKSGSSVRSSANSSITSMRRASPRAAAVSASFAHAESMSLAPISRSTCSRRFSSASSEASARSVSRASRFVTMPTVCGRRSQSANADPPL